VTVPEWAAAFIASGSVSGAAQLLHVESSDPRAKFATFIMRLEIPQKPRRYILGGLRKRGGARAVRRDACLQWKSSPGFDPLRKFKNTIGTA
jgi:hypothetical protein